MPGHAADALAWVEIFRTNPIFVVLAIWIALEMRRVVTRIAQHLNSVERRLEAIADAITKLDERRQITRRIWEEPPNHDPG